MASIMASHSSEKSAKGPSTEDAGLENSHGEQGGSSSFLPPPRELFVPLYLNGNPDEIMETVTVPRWFSDGEVWEVRFRQGYEAGAASQALGNEPLRVP